MIEVAGSLRVPLVRLRPRAAEPYKLVLTVRLEDLSVPSSRVVEDQVEVDLALEISEAELVAWGTLRAEWAGDCRRCLKPLVGRLDLAIREVFVADRKVDGAKRRSRHLVEEVDVYPLGNEEVDLKPMVRDALLLALPLSPLCAPDCLGTDPERFPTGASAEAGGRDEVPTGDSRWSVLDVLRQSTRDPVDD